MCVEWRSPVSLAGAAAADVRTEIVTGSAAFVVVKVRLAFVSDKAVLKIMPLLSKKEGERKRCEKRERERERESERGRLRGNPSRLAIERCSDSGEGQMSGTTAFQPDSARAEGVRRRQGECVCVCVCVCAVNTGFCL